MFQIGDIVKFKGIDLSGNSVPQYYYESNSSIPASLIKHGGSVVGPDYPKNFAEVKAIHEDYFIVEFPSANRGEGATTTLGFKEDVLELVRVPFKGDVPITFKF